MMPKQNNNNNNNIIIITVFIITVFIIIIIFFMFTKDILISLLFAFCSLAYTSTNLGANWPLHQMVLIHLLVINVKHHWKTAFIYTALNSIYSNNNKKNCDYYGQAEFNMLQTKHNYVL